MVEVRVSDRTGTESGHVSALRLVLLARPLSLTAALSTLATLLTVGLLVPTGHPLGMVLLVAVGGALAAFLVSMPVEARFAKRGQLLAQVAEELAGRRVRALQSPAALRDPMAMLAEGFNDALAQVEDRLLGNAVQSSADLIVITDLEGRLSFVNRAFLQAYGYTEEEVLGREAGLVASPRNSAELREQVVAETRRGGWSGEVLTRRKDGTEFPVGVRTSPIRDERGELLGLVAIAHDITERRALETRLHQAQKMEAIGRLAGGVAHDFNNLLGVIQGYGELLKRDVGPRHPGRPRLDHMLKASERAATLTRQLLAFGRRQMVEPRVLRLDAVLADSEPLLRRLAGESVEIEVRTAADLACVRADAGQIDQVLMNLVANARDSMAQGGRVVIEAANVEWSEGASPFPFPAPAGRYVRLSVRDAGTGIDPETMTHIFEPFFTTKERGKGTGLGLATVYGIVKQSGGYIDVKSRPGEGSAFDVYFPVVEGEAEPAKPAANPASSSGGHTILVVEDEDSLREVAREVLESSGYRVLTASCGKEALSVSAAHPHPVRLLLTDVVMPGMSGPELAERLLPERPEMGVLYMSGYAEEVVAQHGTMRRGARLLTKPFSVAALAESVQQALKEAEV
jgi:two-component system cell cycle sensor histidine kinase/response regulator CckA